MTDYRTGACFAFTCSIDEAALIEEAWQVASDLHEAEVSDDEECERPSDAFFAVFVPTIPEDWKSGFLEIFDDPACPEFGAEIMVVNRIESPATCTVTITGRRHFQFDAIAALLQRCCAASLAQAPITFEWGYSSTPARIDGFGGGWCVVFADRIRSGTTSDTIHELTTGQAGPPDLNSVWHDDPSHPVADWQYEVANGDTRLGYHGWIAARRLNDAPQG